MHAPMRGPSICISFTRDRRVCTRRNATDNCEQRRDGAWLASLSQKDILRARARRGIAVLATFTNRQESAVGLREGHICSPNA